jgi:hypothetical protein
MKKYIILEKGLFEKLEKFEERINSQHGYRPINITKSDGGYAVLMEKV